MYSTHGQVGGIEIVDGFDSLKLDDSEYDSDERDLLLNGSSEWGPYVQGGGQVGMDSDFYCTPFINRDPKKVRKSRCGCGTVSSFHTRPE